MKKMIVSLLAIWFLIGSVALAQNEKIPNSVLESFERIYPNVVPYNWEVNEKSLYAFFKLDDKKQVARFNMEGEFTNRGISLKSKKVPDAIQKSFKTDFSNLLWSESEFYSFSTFYGKNGILVISEDDNFKRFIWYAISGELLNEEAFELTDDEKIIEQNEDEG